MKRLILIAAAVFMSATMGLAEMGDDGLHKAPWMRDTFKDLSEDLADANAEGKRLMVIIEQRLYLLQENASGRFSRCQNRRLHRGKFLCCADKYVRRRRSHGL